VKGRTAAVGVALALALVAALIVSAAGSASRNASFKMAIVTDIGSIQDRSFNQLANQGRLAAQGHGHQPVRPAAAPADPERAADAARARPGRVPAAEAQRPGQAAGMIAGRNGRAKSPSRLLNPRAGRVRMVSTLQVGNA
jgi:hypothetical protein